MYDLIIIGAGLSGLSTALSCHSENLSVLILEKGSLPRHKVCGEYLSAEVIPLLDHWGVDVCDRPLVNRALLSAPNGSYREVQLPLGGIGVSRYFLDAALYQAARQREIEIHLQEGVRNVQENKDCFVVETKKQVYKSKYVVSCHGKSSGSHIDTDLPDGKQVYLGVKQYYKLDFPKDLVALHTFKGGYGGAVLVENGWVDMAFMIQQDVFSEYKNIQKVMEAVLFQNPWMKRLLTHGEAMWEQPMAVSNFYLGAKKRSSLNILTAGDAAAMIPPASGNGMAMAILSGALLGKTLREGHENGSSFQEVVYSYRKEWKSFFKRRMFWGKGIQWIMENPSKSKCRDENHENFRSVVSQHNTKNPRFPGKSKKPFMNWNERSRAEEEMDDLQLTGPKLERTLEDLTKVHKWLGGHTQVKHILNQLFEIDSDIQSIVDIGCGGGDSLFSMQSWSQQQNQPLDLYGMDANAAIVSYARQKAEGRIQFSEGNVFEIDQMEKYRGVDVAFFSLFLHHFSDKEILQLLQTCSDLSIRHIVITDLERSVWAYRLFRIATKVIPFSGMARKDGLLSIQKGFTRKELGKLCESSPYKNIHILEWRWAFRYVLIASLGNEMES